MSDEELMMAYASGDEAAFVTLYQKYSPLVYGFIRRRLRESEAEDFYQKVWRHLHEKRHLFSNQPFAPWFFVLMKHLLIDEYRSLGRKTHALNQSELLEKLYALEEVSQEADLEEILNLLAPEARDLVRKYYLEGLSYEELEQETGLSQTNLRQRLSRALRGLKSRVRDL